MEKAGAFVAIAGAFTEKAGAFMAIAGAFMKKASALLKKAGVILVCITLNPTIFLLELSNQDGVKMRDYHIIRYVFLFIVKR